MSCLKKCVTEVEKDAEELHLTPEQIEHVKEIVKKELLSLFPPAHEEPPK